MPEITAYIVRHPRSASERHERLYIGENESLAAAGVRILLTEGAGAYGYVQRDGVTVSYHGGFRDLRPAGGGRHD